MNDRLAIATSMTFHFLLWGVGEGSNSRTGQCPQASHSSLPGRTWARWRGDTGKQDRENAGEEDAIECPRATDRGDRRSKVADPVEIEKVAADKRSHRAADIGERRRVLAGEDKGKDCRGHDRRKHRHCNTDSR